MGHDTPRSGAFEAATSQPTTATSQHSLPPKRDRWASRSTFIIAAVGAAIGLGNVWRFPYLNYKHGGGAFLVPYLLFLVSTGLPLFMAEIALGRLFQKGDVMAFGSIHKRARGVGTISAIGGIGVVTYYSAILSWAAYYTLASFQWPLPWAVQECADADTECFADPERRLPLATSDAFLSRLLLLPESGEDPYANLERGLSRTISTPLYGMLLMTWVLTYFAIWKGVRSVGYAVRVTVVIPWLLLALLIVYNATLDGAGEGVSAYIGRWDWGVLANGSAWSDAAGQVFFTLGATLGMMAAYGSYAPTSTNIYNDASIIAYVNSATSIAAGFAVFAMLGNMAARQSDMSAGSPELRVNVCESFPESSACGGMSCDDCATADWRDFGVCCGDFETNNVAKAGVFVAFSVYPAAMQFLNRGSGNVFAILWFGTLYLLGIDTMFAMVEGIATIITDTPRFSHLRKEFVAFIACITGFLISVAFITDVGFHLVDAFDHYFLNYGLMVVGAIEAYVIAWVWAWPEMVGRTGTTSAGIYLGGFTAASLVGTGLAGALHSGISAGANVAVGVAVGVFIFAASTYAAFQAREHLSQPFREWAEVMSFAGSRNLRTTFKHDPAPWEVMLHVVTFDVMIKYVCVPALLGLFINQAITDAEVYNNGYENYPDWVQSIVGVASIGSMFTALIAFFLFPGFWDAVEGQDDADDIYLAKVQQKASYRAGADINPYLPVLPRNDDTWAGHARH